MWFIIWVLTLVIACGLGIYVGKWIETKEPTK